MRTICEYLNGDAEDADALNFNSATNGFVDLNKHDARYHGGIYKEGDACSLRERMKSCASNTANAGQNQGSPQSSPSIESGDRVKSPVDNGIEDYKKMLSGLKDSQLSALGNYIGAKMNKERPFCSPEQQRIIDQSYDAIKPEAEKRAKEQGKQFADFVNLNTNDTVENARKQYIDSLNERVSNPGVEANKKTGRMDDHEKRTYEKIHPESLREYEKTWNSNNVAERAKKLGLEECFSKHIPMSQAHVAIDKIEDIVKSARQHGDKISQKTLEKLAIASTKLPPGGADLEYDAIGVDVVAWPAIDPYKECRRDHFSEGLESSLAGIAKDFGVTMQKGHSGSEPLYRLDGDEDDVSSFVRYVNYAINEE